MNFIKLYHIFILLSLALPFSSCQITDDATETRKPLQKGAFLATTSYNFVVYQSRGNTAKDMASCANDEMSLQISEEEWISKQDLQTRGDVSGNDFNWEDWANVSLYMDEDGDDKYVMGDIAFNPMQYKTYTQYRLYDPSGKDDPDKYIMDGEQKVGNASFFWDEKTDRPSDMPETLNFYGYYPRPYNNDGNDLYYKKVSIIKKEDAHATTNSNWYNLAYTFSDIQTSDNLSSHDLMCSIPETEDAAEGRYGNQGKTRNSNIQLHFKHVFSLLDIEIDKGDIYDENNDKPCIVSEISIGGNEVYMQGTLNVKQCTTTPSTSSSGIIKRLFTDASIKETPFKTVMLIQPLAKSTDDLSEEERTARCVLSCTIDGAVFKCPLPNIAIEAGKKYKLKLKLSPSNGMVFRIWNGAEVKIGNARYAVGEHRIYNAETNNFTVSATDANMQVVKVFRNGEILPDGDSYPLNYDGKNKVYYDIITKPSEWYAAPKDMNIHFDAIWNNKYDSSQTPSDEWNTHNVWSDLSGNGNDGALKSFDGTSSGWKNSGLDFDGEDDIVTYPGNVREDEYTMELYVSVPDVRQKNYARLIAEGNQYPCYYLAGGNDRRLEVYSHGNQGNFKDYPLLPEGKVQLDFVYSTSDSNANAKTIKLYINGVLSSTQSTTCDAVSIPIASLGNRINDNTRALKATYYSYIQYNRALTEDEILHNYSVNQSRYDAE